MQKTSKLGPWVSNFIFNLDHIDLTIQMERKSSKEFSHEALPLLITQHLTSVSVYGHGILEKQGMISQPLILLLPCMKNATFTIRLSHGTLSVRDLFAQQFKANVEDGHIHLYNVDFLDSTLTGNSPVYASINNAEGNYQIRGTAATEIDSDHRNEFPKEKIRTFRNDMTAGKSRMIFFGK